MMIRLQVFWPLLPLSLAAWVCSGLAMAANGNDNRQVFSGEAHHWLRAVGKLQVPGQRHNEGRTSHYLEDCSATLIARPGRDIADTIVTAWHCLEWYSDLSKPIIFTVVTLSGESLQREAYRLRDGGGMHADWAILRLRKAIPDGQIASLHIHPQSADPEQSITMAGFSKDQGLGNRGRALTFDPSCTITSRDGDIGDTNCTAFKGASGGPVVQMSDSGRPLVCGVVSEGNGKGRSTFVAVSSFRNALNIYLN